MRTAARAQPRPPSPWALVPLLGALAACHEHQRQGFDDIDPAARIHSIHAAAAADDRSALPNLIRALDSDDPAERMLAIRTLERMTGQTLGYDHAAPRAERAVAAQRWADWYAQEAPQFP